VEQLKFWNSILYIYIIMTSEYTDTTDQSIQSIQDLQKLEEQLYARLEQLSANGNKNNLEEQTSLVKQINDEEYLFLKQKYFHEQSHHN